MVSLTGYRPRFKFTFLLLIISLVIVGFSSLWMLEAYQNSLIRQTERMLAIQGIQLASTYRQIFLSEFSETRNNYGIELPGDMPEEFEKSSTRWQLPVRAIFINIRERPIMVDNHRGRSRADLKFSCCTKLDNPRFGGIIVVGVSTVK